MSILPWENMIFWPCLPSLWIADIGAVLLDCEISHVSSGNWDRYNVLCNPQPHICMVSEIGHRLISHRRRESKVFIALFCQLASSVLLVLKSVSYKNILDKIDKSKKLQKLQKLPAN